ncbi:polyprenyl synthetase family protein [Streptomyces sp. SL13]|uniref:Polyprenyl synthetase family protein n=1 Tax=Streptantibioticus silvisoli TaxID=2705255 RepID=A0AA90K1L2_9ACTN|nr:polyprenyl synthetase family protein [Streptantibioticus silvisoli]MDI5973931.1 polyprenyl synthetase family protein [Streptantibioticus silvisoli]
MRWTLERCRNLVRPALTEAVGRLHPWAAEMTAHALGWDVPGHPSGTAGQGKGVRQALTVLGAEAVGAPAAVAVNGAVAVELVHTFSLLHDDIMDGDETRRGRPALWKAYGTGPAVLAGDALFALAVGVLAETPGPHATTAVRKLTAALHDLVRGQADDLLFESRPWYGPEAVSRTEYLAMAEAKTGALLGCAVALGAVLGGAEPATVAALDRFGRHLGTAFQAVDDLLGLWGSPHDTGKPVHGDLRRAKKTLPVLAALESAGPDARRLAALLADPGPLDADRAARAADLVARAGGRDAALAEATRHLALADACLTDVPLHGTATAELRALRAFLLGRRG